jgi:hypothetical protein
MSIASVASIRSHFQFNLRIHDPSNSNHHHTTPLPTPSLLALPREIRNKIYTHLSQTISFDWKWRVTKTKRAIFTVHIPHAPRLSLLLVCSRFYSEMLEILGKRVIIHWADQLHQHMQWHTTFKEGKGREKKYEKALERATSVAILTLDLDWSVMERFCKKVRRYVPQMAAISVCGHTWVAGRRPYFGFNGVYGIRSEQLPARLTELRGDRKCMEKVPASLTDLRFVQFARSVRIGTEVLWTLAESPQGYHQYFGTSAISHNVEKMEVYSFAGQNQRVCADRGDVIEVFWPFWPFTEVSNDLVLPKHDEESIERFKVPTWDECRIDEVAVEKQDSAKEEGFARWFV